MLAPLFVIAAGPCIAIDPGHGGSRDDGTTYLEHKEKHLTLAYARALRDALEELVPGYRAVLTRDDDRDLSLTERARIANHAGCRVLVSLHVNGSVQARMNGIETYYLDTLKARLGRRLRETVGKKLDDPSLIVRELRARRAAESSTSLAGNVHEALVDSVHTFAPEVRSNGTRHDLLQLLLAAEMPGVLVEIGYLSNPAERARLLDARYQRAVVRGIAQGVKAYLGEAR